MENSYSNLSFFRKTEFKEHIRVLNNQDATKTAILEGLNWLKEKAESDPHATVFVYYSGHGWDFLHLPGRAKTNNRVSLL